MASTGSIIHVCFPGSPEESPRPHPLKQLVRGARFHTCRPRHKCTTGEHRVICDAKRSRPRIKEVQQLVIIELYVRCAYAHVGPKHAVQLSDRSGHQALLARPLHREGLARSCLPVCKNASIPARRHGIYNWLANGCVDVLLSGLRAKHFVENPTVLLDGDLIWWRALPAFWWLPIAYGAHCRTNIHPLLALDWRAKPYESPQAFAGNATLERRPCGHLRLRPDSARLFRHEADDVGKALSVWVHQVATLASSDLLRQVYSGHAIAHNARREHGILRLLGGEVVEGAQVRLALVECGEVLEDVGLPHVVGVSLPEHH
mmetsp:Transcript_45899/g.132958  ORF Transcript_45899/g.132958 Transcript_45899/m.132958 type:complete len:317 (-) Transcript_45899:1007-1957(-)